MTVTLMHLSEAVELGNVHFFDHRTPHIILVPYSLRKPFFQLSGGIEGQVIVLHDMRTLDTLDTCIVGPGCSLQHMVMTILCFFTLR